MASISAALTASQASLSAARRRAVLAATVGNALEWYDFLIYGFLAMTIAKLFFPTESELTSLLLSVGTFGAAAVVRPVASVVLGIYADRVGRKAALTLTIFTMGLGTGLIVVAPTYASIGIWAAVLMVIARLLQGFACGGEMGGATAILVENAPDHSRGLYASWQTASQAAGVPARRDGHDAGFFVNDAGSAGGLGLALTFRLWAADCAGWLLHQIETQRAGCVSKGLC